MGRDFGRSVSVVALKNLCKASDEKNQIDINTIIFFIISNCFLTKSDTCITILILEGLLTGNFTTDLKFHL